MYVCVYIYIYIYIYCVGSLQGPRTIASSYSKAAQQGTETVWFIINLAQGE